MALVDPLAPAVYRFVTVIKDKFTAVEARIGHQFADKTLLERALTHSSALAQNQPARDSYQRLEFLGDRVLALVIADMLIKTFANADEGELAQRLNQLVRRETCAAVADDLDLGSAIRLAPSEARTGGRRKQALLGDVCESVIAAIYQDAGLEGARRFIENNWHQRMISATGPFRDAKTTLQEWAQGRGLPLPDYRVTERLGPDHNPTFTVQVEVGDLKPARGAGRSRRGAEQAAAEALLEAQGVWPADRTP